MVPVSATTGAGLDELRAALASVAAAVPERESTHSFRMPVDRVFTMQGFGTVVTGTVLSGAIDTETEVVAFPSESRLRVRGVQVHGARAQRATAGQRAAVNLAGTAVEDLQRGSVLTRPGEYKLTSLIDCVIDLLPSAKPLKHRAPVHFHAGTAEVIAEVRLAAGQCNRTGNHRRGSPCARRGAGPRARRSIHRQDVFTGRHHWRGRGDRPGAPTAQSILRTNTYAGEGIVTGAYCPGGRGIGGRHCAARPGREDRPRSQAT